jgi:hypothetical protein
MISIKKADYNLSRILKSAKLHSLRPEHDYYIYGLKLTPSNPPIRIQLSIEDDTEIPYQNIIKFLANSGIKCNYGRRYECDEEITIGLRKDVRDDIIFSACLLQTIIYACEFKISLIEPYIKIPRSPKLLTLTKTK